MKFGAHSFIWTPQFGRADLALIPEMKRRGFDGIELPIFAPADLPAKEIRQVLEDCGMGCTFTGILTAGQSLISPDAEVRARGRRQIAESAEVVAACGGSVLAGPLYAPIGYMAGRRRNEDEWKRVVECYQSLGEVLDRLGVNVAIEPLNRFETYFLNTQADGVRLCEAIGHPRVGVLFDTFHANIEEKDLGAACRSVGAYLKHFHVSENDRGIPGSGHVDWCGVFTALRDLRYDGWMTIESFGFAQGDLAAAASIWRDLAPQPEQIAYEGLAFLRRNWAAA